LVFYPGECYYIPATSDRGGVHVVSGVATEEWFVTKRKGVLLTKTVVDAAKAAGKRFHLWDSELIGFGLRIEPTGVKTFIAKYRANGGGRTAPQRVVTIARFGTLTADQARKQAKKILGGAARGGRVCLDRAVRFLSGIPAVGALPILAWHAGRA
jgi:hypothetical protein